MAATQHKVVKGDTLSEIAAKYKKDYGYTNTYTYMNKLVKINGIDNPNLIYIGQIVKLAGSEAKTSKNTSSNKAVIKHFGLQSNSDNTLFATWTWNKSNTDTYATRWYYSTGDGVWFIGSDSSSTTASLKQATYSIPANAKQVKFLVKPIAKKHKVTKNKKETEVAYWTAEWSKEKIYTVEKLPEPPSITTPTITKNTFKIELDNLDTSSPNGTHIQFEIVKDDGAKAYKTSGKLKITNKYVSYSCTVASGGKYKVRCRAIRGALTGEWSSFSSNAECNVPSPVKAIKALYSQENGTSIHVDWDHVKGVKSYEIEYTTKKVYFDYAQNEVTSVPINPDREGDAPPNYAIITGLESGQEYFFRMRSANGEEKSEWTAVKSIKLGTKPAAPTTWSSTTTVVTGEPLTLYWVHNSEDGSSQTEAELQIRIGSSTNTEIIENSTDPDEKDKTSFYTIDTSEYEAGAVIKWRVRTRGITNTYSDWSTQRTVTVYAQPTLELVVTNVDDVDADQIDILESFPFYIRGYTEPSTQKPIGYNIEIISHGWYETADSVGNIKVVNDGDVVYSKYVSSSATKSGIAWARISAENVDLENNVDYTIRCVASMNSGLTAEAEHPFTVSWSDVDLNPDAEVMIDNTTLTAEINPYCERYAEKFYEATRTTTADGEILYIATTTERNMVTRSRVEDTYTTSDNPELDGYPVYKGRDSSKNTRYYYIVEESQQTIVPGVTLSVYRREFDGSFTAIAEGLNNKRGIYVTDPHPALDLARYRIVAVKNSTGSVSYTDLPGIPVGESAIVLQWDEEWSDFEIDEYDHAEEIPPWTGSMLKLPYNVDVTENVNPDVELVEYIGRSHPVGYYGTQIGSSATWNAIIEKSDAETLYGLRRLQRWMGNVYVREPSGTGYWAHITVSFNQKHCDKTIPVTLNITRVEGGM